MRNRAESLQGMINFFTLDRAVGDGTTGYSSAQTASQRGEGSIFQWKDSYRIGVPEIDQQHKILFARASKYQLALDKGMRNNSNIDLTLKDLFDYTEFHFSFEENLMQENNCPDFDAHKAKHIKLVVELKELRQRFQDGEEKIDSEISIFLSDLLIKHVGVTDFKYAPYVNKELAA
jgi:hemerythrin-like metal-binding protein